MRDACLVNFSTDSWTYWRLNLFLSSVSRASMSFSHSVRLNRSVLEKLFRIESFSYLHLFDRLENVAGCLCLKHRNLRYLQRFLSAD